MRHKNFPHRRGVIAVLAAVVMVVMLAGVAFAVDLGYIVLGRTQLQAAADAGAHAGAAALRAGADAARSSATSYSEKMIAAGGAVKIIPLEDIELGTWDAAAKTFKSLSSSDEKLANAVRVTCQLSSARGNAANLFFGRIFGKTNIDLSATAIAHTQRIRCGRFVGIESTSFQGGLTDSYDSRLGSYAAQEPQ